MYYISIKSCAADIYAWFATAVGIWFSHVGKKVVTTEYAFKSGLI